MPREVAIDGAAKAARLFTTTTGHSQIGEFTPSKRTLKMIAGLKDVKPMSLTKLADMPADH